jgi:hypothetical protein
MSCIKISKQSFPVLIKKEEFSMGVPECQNIGITVFAAVK